ncbi:MAG: hypothetical protein WCW30_02120 [Candidatus Gracilibacteria bacterium]
MSPSFTLSEADRTMSRLIMIDYTSGRITSEEALGYLYLLKQEGGLFLVTIAGQKTYLSLEDMEALKERGIKDEINVILDRSYAFAGTTTENQKEHSISFKSLKSYYKPIEMTDEDGHTFVGTSATRLEQKWLPLLREEMRNPSKKEEKTEEKEEKPEAKTEKKEEPKTEKEKILDCIDRDLEDGLLTEEDAEIYRKKAESGELMLVEMGGEKQDYYLPVDKAQTLLGNSASASLGLQVAQTTHHSRSDSEVSSSFRISSATAVGISTAENQETELEGQGEKLTIPLVAADAVDEQAKKDKKKKEEEKEGGEKGEKGEKTATENNEKPLIPNESQPIVPGIIPTVGQKSTTEKGSPAETQTEDIPAHLLAKGSKDLNEMVSSKRILSEKATLPSKRMSQSSMPASPMGKTGGNITLTIPRETQPDQTPNRWSPEQEQRKQLDQKRKQAEDVLTEQKKRQQAMRYQQAKPATQQKNLMAMVAKVAGGAAVGAGALGAGTVLFIQTSDASEHIAFAGHMLHSIFLSLA